MTWPSEQAWELALTEGSAEGLARRIDTALAEARRETRTGRHWRIIADQERAHAHSLQAERDRYAQALWNVLVTLGEEGDGDPSPAGHIAGMGHDGFAEMAERSVRRHRDDDDGALDESIEAENQIKRLTDERDELRAEVERLRRLVDENSDRLQEPHPEVERLRGQARKYAQEGDRYARDIRAALDRDPC